MHVNLTIETDSWNPAVVFSSCYCHPTEHEGRIRDSTSFLSSLPKAQKNCLHGAFLIPNAMLLYSEFLHRWLIFNITKQSDVIEQFYLMEFSDSNCDRWIYAPFYLKCLNYWIEMCTGINWLIFTWYGFPLPPLCNFCTLMYALDYLWTHD